MDRWDSGHSDRVLGDITRGPFPTPPTPPTLSGSPSTVTLGSVYRFLRPVLCLVGLPGSTWTDPSGTSEERDLFVDTFICLNSEAAPVLFYV